MIDNIESRFADAVAEFWSVRKHQAERQIEAGRVDAGLRGAVTGGGQMAGFERLTKDILIGAGIPDAWIQTRRALELPGYYRPEKKWDLLVVSNDVLHVAIEFKSQVGPSFGNNFNNRSEEALGNAQDVLLAYREKRLGKTVTKPLLGYFFVLEDCLGTHRLLRLAQPHFKVDPIFVSQVNKKKGISYAQRYEVLIERLLLEQLYDLGALTLTTNAVPTTITFPNAGLHPSQLFARLEGFAVGLVKAGL